MFSTVSEFFSKIPKPPATIVVIGFGSQETSASRFVARFLRDKGYSIIPVNPKLSGLVVEGMKVYGSISEIPVGTKIDLIDFFVPGEIAFKVSQESLKFKPRTLWLQEGIVSPNSRKLAQNNGIDYVENVCIMKVLKGLA